MPFFNKLGILYYIVYKYISNIPLFNEEGTLPEVVISSLGRKIEHYRQNWQIDHRRKFKFKIDRYGNRLITECHTDL